MHSQLETIPEVALKAATQCVGEILDIREIKRGGNARVYKITGVSQTTVLKWVAPGRSVELLNECEAYNLLRSHGVDLVPATMCHQTGETWALFSHLDGLSADRSEFSSGDIQQFVHFVNILKILSRKFQPDFQRASDSCISLDETLQRIQTRRDAMNIGLNHDLSIAARDLLAEWDEAWLNIQAHFIKRADAHKAFFERTLTRQEQILNPSDFGPHNAKLHHGTWRFLDFEYFGWDDPAKLIVDFIWHPAFDLEPALTEQWKNSCLALWDNTELNERVQRIQPLHGLKWCLIALNVFSNHHENRRTFTEGSQPDSVKLSLRLDKAKSILNMSQHMMETRA